MVQIVIERMRPKCELAHSILMRYGLWDVQTRLADDSRVEAVACRNQKKSQIVRN